MHCHDDGIPRAYIVTLMSDELPDPQVHQIGVDTPCICDMWDFVLTLDDLPFKPAFMLVERRPPLTITGTPGFRSSSSS
jgi:hypothetical protein